MEHLAKINGESLMEAVGVTGEITTEIHTAGGCCKTEPGLGVRVCCSVEDLTRDRG